MHKTIVRYTTLIVFALIIGSATAKAQNIFLDFTLINKTGVDIYELYISPSDAEYWEDNIIGSDPLEHNTYVDIEFSPYAASDFWDIMIVDYEGTSVIFEQLNLTDILELTLYIDGSRVWAEWE
jgi:hypothetical protein